MNTFSWVICKCQSGNGAERGGGGERGRSQKKTVATTGCFLLPESRNQKAQARLEPRERRGGRRGGTEEVGTGVEGAWVEGDGGGRVVDREETESGKTV